MEVKRYKAGKLKGEITTAEIRKLIRAHNKASSIKIPPKSTREDIVGILQKAGYSVNHEKAELRPVSKGKVQKLKVVSQKTIAKELPKPKTNLEKQKAKEQKQEKQMEKKKQERTERKEIVQKALKQQEKTISKKKDKEKTLKKETLINKNKVSEKLNDKNKNISNNKMTPKITAEQIKSIKVIEPKKKEEKIKVIIPSLKGVFETTPKKMYEVLRKKFPQTFKLKKGELEQFGDTVGQKQDGVETLTEEIREKMKKMKVFKKYMETFNKLNKEVLEKHKNEKLTNFDDLLEDAIVPPAEQIFNVWFKNRVEFKNAGFEPHGTADEDFKYRIKKNEKEQQEIIDTLGELFNVSTEKINVKFE